MTCDCDYSRCNNGWGCPVRSTLITANSDATSAETESEYDDFSPMSPEGCMTIAALVFGVVCAIALICVAAIIYG